MCHHLMDLFKINVQIRKCEVDTSFFLFLKGDEDASATNVFCFML